MNYCFCWLSTDTVAIVAGLYTELKSEILSKNNIIGSVLYQTIISLHFSEEIDDFVLRKLLEGLGLVGRLNDSNLDITLSKFSFEAVFKALDSRVDGVFNIDVILVSLLEVVSSSIASSSHSSGFPAVEGARSFNLIDLRTIFFRVSSNHNSDSERADTTTLSVLLEELSESLGSHEGSHFV